MQPVRVYCIARAPAVYSYVCAQQLISLSRWHLPRPTPQHEPRARLRWLPPDDACGKQLEVIIGPAADATGKQWDTTAAVMITSYQRIPAGAAGDEAAEVLQSRVLNVYR